MPAFGAPAFDRADGNRLAERVRREGVGGLRVARGGKVPRERHGRSGDHRRQEQSSGPHGCTSSVEIQVRTDSVMRGPPEPCRPIPHQASEPAGNVRGTKSYLPVPPEPALPDEDEPLAPEEPAPLAPEEPPDWPCVLLTAEAPVPDLSKQSFGIALREAYLASSQRASFCAACDFLSFLSLIAVPLP